MPTDALDLLVEEPSMEAFLQTFLPLHFPSLFVSIYPFSSKYEMRRKLEERLRGYTPWLGPTHRVFVLIDRDEEDCRELKSEIERCALAAGLRSKSAAPQEFQLVNRVVVEELEAWYFGDWEAVCRAYPKVPPTIPSQSSYRDPDSIRGGTWEALERIFQRAGYFLGGLAKIQAARTIAAEMTAPQANRSRSFQAFFQALQSL